MAQDPGADIGTRERSGSFHYVIHYVDTMDVGTGSHWCLTSSPGHRFVSTVTTLEPVKVPE